MAKQRSRYKLVNSYESRAIETSLLLTTQKSLVIVIPLFRLLLLSLGIHPKFEKATEEETY